MKRSIVICEYISTGINYIDDARARGYEPVLVEGTYIGTEEELALRIELPLNDMVSVLVASVEN